MQVTVQFLFILMKYQNRGTRSKKTSILINFQYINNNKNVISWKMLTFDCKFIVKPVSNIMFLASKMESCKFQTRVIFSILRNSQYVDDDKNMISWIMLTFDCKFIVKPVSNTMFWHQNWKIVSSGHELFSQY